VIGLKAENNFIPPPDSANICHKSQITNQSKSRSIYARKEYKEEKLVVRAPGEPTI
jgi:hypothetical protein